MDPRSRLAELAPACRWVRLLFPRRVVSSLGRAPPIRRGGPRPRLDTTLPRMLHPRRMRMGSNGSGFTPALGSSGAANRDADRGHSPIRRLGSDFCGRHWPQNALQAPGWPLGSPGRIFVGRIGSRTSTIMHPDGGARPRLDPRCLFCPKPMLGLDFSALGLCTFSLAAETVYGYLVEIGDLGYQI